MRNSNAILSNLWLNNLQGAREATYNAAKCCWLQWRNRMTNVKLLSAALIAAAMLTAPAMARESQIKSRHLAMDANVSAAPSGGPADERHCRRAPAVGAFATPPWVQPPCEPAR
jgi:hypothetical protein